MNTETFGKKGLDCEVEAVLVSYITKLLEEEKKDEWDKINNNNNNKKKKKKKWKFCFFPSIYTVINNESLKFLVIN